MSVRDAPLENPQAKVSHWRIVLYQPAPMMNRVFEHCTNLTHNAARRGISFVTQAERAIHTSLPFLAEEED